MEETENKIVDISPVSKGKRMLISLADIFLNFVIAVFFFSLAVFPITKVITHYDDMTSQISSYQEQRIQLLYDNGLLDSEGKEDSTFNTDFEYSAKKYLRSVIDGNHDKDYIYHYYIEIKGVSEEDMVSVYKTNDYGFFDFYPELKMKDKYVTLLSPVLDENDTLSEEGETAYSKFINSFFTQIYGTMLNDLETLNDGSSLARYGKITDEIEEISNTQLNIVAVSTVIAYFIISVVYFVVIPLCNRFGRTIAMMAMRVDRIGNDNLRPLRRTERPVIGFISILFSLLPIMFVPMFYVSFTALFSVIVLFVVSLVSLILLIVSMLIILFSYLGRSLTDRMTKTVYINRDTFDQLIVMKGFRIYGGK